MLCIIIPPAWALVISFTGNVTRDFPVGPGVFVATDVVRDVQLSSATPSGWDINDVRFSYDATSDTAYFGEWVPNAGL